MPGKRSWYIGLPLGASWTQSCKHFSPAALNIHALVTKYAWPLLMMSDNDRPLLHISYNFLLDR